MQIRKAERRRKERETAQRLRALQRANQITMFRAYRIGELPDLDIKHNEVRERRCVLLLQAKCARGTELPAGRYSAVMWTLLDYSAAASAGAEGSGDCATGVH